MDIRYHNYSAVVPGLTSFMGLKHGILNDKISLHYGRVK